MATISSINVALYEKDPDSDLRLIAVVVCIELGAEP